MCPSSPSPQAGGNQSCLTVPLSVWSYDTCQIKKVNPLRQGQGAPSCATLGWRRVAQEGGMRVAWGHHLYYTYKKY